MNIIIYSVISLIPCFGGLIPIFRQFCVSEVSRRQCLAGSLSGALALAQSRQTHNKIIILLQTENFCCDCVGIFQHTPSMFLNSS